jgi:hypothetical protein
MTPPFQTLQLEAPSLYALIGTWAETQLLVTREEARIVGYGYPQEVAAAFTALVFDWEATIFLPRETLPLTGGTYDLILKDGTLLACRDQRSTPIPDQPVRVEVRSVPENE